MPSADKGNHESVSPPQFNFGWSLAPPRTVAASSPLLPEKTPTHVVAVPDQLSPMANFPVDPMIFVPRRYGIVEVEGRPQECRYHISSSFSRKHEDIAIATITPARPPGTPLAHIRALHQHLVMDVVGFRLDMCL